jgi:hypothetical protein
MEDEDAWGSSNSVQQGYYRNEEERNLKGVSGILFNDLCQLLRLCSVN